MRVGLSRGRLGWTGRSGWVAEKFDRRAASYDDSAVHRWQAEQAVKLLAPGRGQWVLDVVTGTGLAARGVAKRLGAGGAVVGLDVSLGMLRQARRIARGTRALPNHYGPRLRNSANECGRGLRPCMAPSLSSSTESRWCGWDRIDRRSLGTAGISSCTRGERPAVCAVGGVQPAVLTLGVVECGDADAGPGGAAQGVEGGGGVLDGGPQRARAALDHLPRPIVAGDELGLGERVEGVGDDAAGLLAAADAQAGKVEPEEQGEVRVVGEQSARSRVVVP